MLPLNAQESACPAEEASRLMPGKQRSFRYGQHTDSTDPCTSTTRSLTGRSRRGCGPATVAIVNGGPVFTWTIDTTADLSSCPNPHARYRPLAAAHPR